MSNLEPSIERTSSVDGGDVFLRRRDTKAISRCLVSRRCTFRDEEIRVVTVGCKEFSPPKTDCAVRLHFSLSKTRSGPKIPAADQLEGGDFLG